MGRIACLTLGATVQAVTHLGQRLTAACHLLGIDAQGAYQIDQIVAQVIERGLDIAQFTIGLAQLNVVAEIPLRPGRQQRRQSGQHIGQSALQRVDQ